MRQPVDDRGERRVSAIELEFENLIGTKHPFLPDQQNVNPPGTLLDRALQSGPGWRRLPFAAIVDIESALRKLSTKPDQRQINSSRLLALLAPTPAALLYAYSRRKEFSQIRIIDVVMGRRMPRFAIETKCIRAILNDVIGFVVS